MSRQATSRLKVNPPLGLRPSLENCRIPDLAVDPVYQRSTDTGASKALIRKIAQHWDWALFHPLCVARREDGSLWVVDGQHRLEAAKLRRDLYDLPCVVTRFGRVEDEAASFVAMNQQRRPLSKIDLFKAAVASEDGEASAIMRAIGAAGLSVAPHSNFTAWKPGMLCNIGGLEAVRRRHGHEVLALSLKALGEALGDQVLRYAGSIFPGIAAVVAHQATSGGFDPVLWECFVEMIREGEQETWRRDILNMKADLPNLRFAVASERLFLTAWADLVAELVDA